MKNNTRQQMTGIVDEVLLLSRDLKQALKTTSSEDELNRALLTLLITQVALYTKLATIFKHQTSSKIIEFAALARLLLENYAVICWILAEPSKKYGRAKRFIDTGWDLQVHYNSIFKHGFGKVKRTRTRLDSTETLLKAVDIPQILNWYDELNYFIHPSSAVLTQSAIGGTDKTITFGTWVAGNILADSILKVDGKLEFSDGIIEAARKIHELYISDI